MSERPILNKFINNPVDIESSNKLRRAFLDRDEKDIETLANEQIIAFRGLVETVELGSEDPTSLAILHSILKYRNEYKFSTDDLLSYFHAALDELQFEGEIQIDVSNIRFGEEEPDE
jgi:hypothetical protein